MRILVVGAGAIGGYFGGRLLEAGRDVTFLVRQRRAAQLAKTGLAIRSPHGDVTLPNPPAITADALREPFDLVLLSCKAYDLKSAINSFAPVVGGGTAILPVLNGMGHLDVLSARFGDRAVLGGQCAISSTLDAEGRILHLSDFHSMSFGECDGTMSTRANAIASALSGARFELASQQSDPAGDVGKVGPHRRNSRHHLLDAVDDRRHRRCGRRPMGDGFARRMRCHRNRTKLCAQRAVFCAQQDPVDDTRLHICRIDAARY